ncbi:MAG: hypothetical protein KF700_11995 [Hyphomonadaceae bacterium]|nr:hypothetical protein [Hyphomonadaceae bacterium]
MHDHAKPNLSSRVVAALQRLTRATEPSAAPERTTSEKRKLAPIDQVVAETGREPPAND